LDVQKKPKSSKSIIALLASSILETIFSQYLVGKVETLTSIFLCSNFNSYFQSCGTLEIFSFNLEAYFNLSKIYLYSKWFSVKISTKTQSILNLKIISFS
jgi:hypothetical protein